MAKRMMNLADVKVGTCYVSALRNKVVSIVRVAHTDAEKKAMFGAKYKKTRTNDAPMWEAIGNNDGKKHIAGSADDLHKLEFVPKTDKRWFDPNKPQIDTVVKTSVDAMDGGIDTIQTQLTALKQAGVWGASTLQGDFDRFLTNLNAVCDHYNV